MINNKKAQGEFWHFIDLMFTSFILIFIFFFVTFLINTEREITVDKINAMSYDFKASDASIVYLQSPIELDINGEKQVMTIADSLMLVEIENYDNQVTPILKRTKKLLDPIYGPTKWAINICYPRRGKHVVLCWLTFNRGRWLATKKGSDGNFLAEVKTKIPSLNGGDITVKFRLLK